MRLLVTGDRNWTRYGEILRALRVLEPQFCILGDARGADSLARTACEELEIPYRVHKADWLQFGRAAGPLRNRAMLDDNPTHVIYFHDDLSTSRGTKNCVDQARKRHLPIIDGKGL